jgi:hypothetical protein
MLSPGSPLSQSPSMEIEVGIPDTTAHPTPLTLIFASLRWSNITGFLTNQINSTKVQLQKFPDSLANKSCKFTYYLQFLLFTISTCKISLLPFSSPSSSRSFS